MNQAIKIDIDAIRDGAAILRSLSPNEPRGIPSGLRAGVFQLRRYGLIEPCGDNCYRLTMLGADYAMALAPIPTPAQRLARALCASRRIDTGDGVCAGMCEARGSNGVCEHAILVHEMWAGDLLRELAR